MNAINTEENLMQNNFVAKVFLECYNKFNEISVLSEDYITEFQSVIENDGQSLLLDLTGNLLQADRNPILLKVLTKNSGFDKTQVC